MSIVASMRSLTVVLSSKPSILPCVTRSCFSGSTNHLSCSKQSITQSIRPQSINQSTRQPIPAAPRCTNPCHLPEDIPMVSNRARSHLAPTGKSSVGLNNRPCRSPVNCRPLQTVSADSLHTAGPCEGSKRSRETLMKPIDMTAQNQGKGTPRRRDDRRAQ